MKFTDLITICIPVYERYDFFEEAIHSAINQTVTCKIIVSDNGSTHNKFELFCSANNIEYYKNDFNIGMFGNWNKCCKYTRTLYLSIMGDDDMLSITYIEEFVRAFEIHNDIDFYFSNVELLSKAGVKPWPYSAVYGFNKKSLVHQEQAAMNGIGLPSLSGIYKKSILEQSPFPDKFYGSNDWLWLYSKIHTFNVFGNPKVLYTYRQHDMQDSGINSFITYHWSYPVIYYEIFVVLNKYSSEYSKECLKKSIDFAKNTIRNHTKRFIEYYNELDNTNYYKKIYKQDLSKKNSIISLINLPKKIANLLILIIYKRHLFINK